jgi:lactoylglutathione lyase
MKRFHVHLHVDDLGRSIGFHSKPFGAGLVRAEAADPSLPVEGAITRCHAGSEKHWVTDPQGIAWEHFHTLADIPLFREARVSEARVSEARPAACCTLATAASAATAASSPKCC